MRHTKAHTRNRRSHHALKVNGLGLCEQCATPKMRHRACETCGTYRGRQVLDKEKALSKKAEAISSGSKKGE
ncbi:MAG: 50S ribosomal protein L32 [bacterium]|nr:50S ribosomal protein L32 [bacterium]